MEKANEPKKVKLSTVYGEMCNQSVNNDTHIVGNKKVISVSSLYPSKMIKEVDKNV